MSERSPTTKSNLALRLLTAAPWVPLLIYLLYWAPPWAFPAVAGVICALGARELFRMVAPLHRALCVWGVVASVAVFGLIALPAGPRYLAPALVAITCLGMLVVLAAPEPLETAANRVGWAIAGPLYVGALFGAVAQLFQREHGGSWVMLALFCAFWSDTAAYFVGRRFGKHKLSAVVSPKKSVEGSIGGLLGGMAGGIVAHFWLLPELSLLAAIVLSLVATAAGQAGDLCESLIKRSAGVKDSGAILPGHGGLLDRTDAMLFCAAVIWLYLELDSQY
jgi:phosphatidate cytidylyltransferase